MTDWLATRLQPILAAIDTPFQWLIGTAGGKPSYEIGHWLFLRALGLIYLIAFVSLWVQVKGLIGPHGILPAQDYLQALRRYVGPERYRIVPTVLWLDAGGRALDVVCALGVICAALVLAGVWPGGVMLCLWVLYLSLVAAGRDFLSFQWDVLLLEAGFLAIFLGPWRLWSGRLAPAAPPALALFLMWWLVFRLTFQSGVVKLSWGDPTWRGLTALDYHFYTQPLPTWTAWYMHQLPAWLKKLEVLATFGLEIAVPLLFFGPRSLRLVAVAGTVLFQLAIFATGNYNFFNLLTIALVLLLVDDAAWRVLLPDTLLARLPSPSPAGEVAAAPGVVRMGLTVIVAAVFLVLGAVRVWDSCFPRTLPPTALVRLNAWIEPFRSLNGYGLFRVMTTSRPEIIVEGSDDGALWRAYEFKYKPGDLARRPGFVEPHQPRLDWQMWFAALDDPRRVRWFPHFLERVLRNEPAVMALLDKNPFPDKPPVFVRARFYDYTFASSEEKARGVWWDRRLLGVYFPASRLK
jgi:lipase maturation factor 1